MSVVMAHTAVMTCVTTHMEHTIASAVMVMSFKLMASHVKVQKLHQTLTIIKFGYLCNMHVNDL